MSSDSRDRASSESSDEKEVEKEEKSLHELVRKFCEDVTRYLNKREILEVTVRGDRSGRRYEVTEDRSDEVERKVVEKRCSDHACQLEARLPPPLVDTRESRPLSMISSVSSCAPSSSSGYSTSSQWSSSTAASEMERRLENALLERDRLYLELLEVRGTVAQLERNGEGLVRRTAVRRKGNLTPIQEKKSPQFQFPAESEMIQEMAGLRDRIAKLKEGAADEKTKDLLKSIGSQLGELVFRWLESRGEEGVREGLREIENVIERLETEQQQKDDDRTSDDS